MKVFVCSKYVECEDDTLDELGVWVEMAAVLPVGSEIEVGVTDLLGEVVCLTILQWQQRLDGAIWCEVEPPSFFPPAEPVRRELESVGWVSWFDAERQRPADDIRNQ